MHTTIGWVYFTRYGTLVLTRKTLCIGVGLWLFLTLICLVVCHSLGSKAVGICLAGLLLTVSFTDYSTLNIPHELIGLIGVLSFSAFLLGSPDDIDLIRRCIGCCAVSIPLFVVALAVNGFGGGDIKLMAAMGFLLGVDRALIALFLAVVVGMGYALTLILTGKITRKDVFPFGPALSIGSFIAFLL